MKTALGKGLGALIPQRKDTSSAKTGGTEVIEIELQRIVAGTEQPRKSFNDDALKELAASIKEKGIIQPILVKRQSDGSFMIIAGERRTRASKLAGLKSIPAIVREADTEDALEIALIENIQREDLNSVETARAFERLMTQFSLTQEQLSQKVGKERATVANYMRLLQLPKEVLDLVSRDKISMGHARAILAIDGNADRINAAKKIISGGLSVRAAEKLARDMASDQKTKSATKNKKTPEVASLEEKLIRALGTKVAVNDSGNKGNIMIEYYSLEELERLLDILL
jgi:ParB family chromosome partitioning protein